MPNSIAVEYPGGDLMHFLRRVSIWLAVAMVLSSTTAFAQYSSPVRDVDNPDRFPYQESSSFSLDPPFLNHFVNFATPAGKRYVIEHVAINCQSPDNFDTFPQVYLNVRSLVNAGSSMSIPLPSLPRTGGAAFGGSAFAMSTRVKAYSNWDPFAAGNTGGQGISLNVFHTNASVRASCVATITGHAVTP